MLRLHLEQVDATDATIADIDKEVERMLEPFRAQVTLLKTMPGIRDLLASKRPVNRVLPQGRSAVQDVLCGDEVGRAIRRRSTTRFA